MNSSFSHGVFRRLEQITVRGLRQISSAMQPSDVGRSLGRLVGFALLITMCASGSRAEITNGLVLKYDFNEQRGIVVYDDSRYRNDSFLDATTDYTNPSWGKQNNEAGLYFDGANDLLNVGDYDVLDVNRFTIAAWVKYKDINQGVATNEENVTRLKRRNHEVVEKIGSYWMNIRLAREGRKLRAGGRFRGCAGYQFVNVSSSEPVPENTWTHVASTYDGFRLRLFINGKPVGSRSARGNKCDSEHPLVIGAKYTPLPYSKWPNGVITNNFHGNIDDLVIYNRALTPWEIKKISGITKKKPEAVIEVASQKWGRLRLAIMSTRLADGDRINFSASSVQRKSVTFGRAEAHRTWLQDIDRDGDKDLVLVFEKHALGNICVGPEHILSGKTKTGDSFTGRVSTADLNCN